MPILVASPGVFDKKYSIRVSSTVLISENGKDLAELSTKQQQQINYIGR
jgi:hypothetical protein